MDRPLIDKTKVLNKLLLDTKPLWGKMTAQHMIEHLNLAVKMSNGKLIVECFNPPEKIPTLKRFLMSNRPLPKEFVNPYIGTGLLPLKYKNLDDAKNILISKINDYYEVFEKNPEAAFINVTFGELNKIEWAIFHEKHFNHHFSQFGLL